MQLSPGSYREPMASSLCIGWPQQHFLLIVAFRRSIRDGAILIPVPLLGFTLGELKAVLMGTPPTPTSSARDPRNRLGVRCSGCLEILRL